MWVRFFMYTVFADAPKCKYIFLSGQIKYGKGVQPGLDEPPA